MDIEEALVQRREMECPGGTDPGGSRQTYDLCKTLTQSAGPGESDPRGVDELFALLSWLLTSVGQAGQCDPSDPVLLWWQLLARGIDDGLHNNARVGWPHRRRE